MSMLNERLQVLISADQRRRLEAEAQRRGTSVATVVRDAIDASVGRPTLAERRAAVEAIKAMKGKYLTPQEIVAIVAEEREQNVPELRSN